MNESSTPPPNDWAPPQGSPQPTDPTPTVFMGGTGPFTNVLGYDPSDYESWPYGFIGPYNDLHLEPLTMERAPELDCMELLAEYITVRYDDDGPSEARMLDMALRLFLHVATDRSNRQALDPRVNGLSHTDIFAACLDTAIIWERG